METKKIQAVITSANVTANVSGGQINTTIGEAARMETQQAVHYIKAGTDEIASAVAAGKAELDNEGQQYVDLAKDWATKTSGTVDGTDYSAKYYAQSILPISAEITTVAGIASDVATVGGIASDVSSVAANNADISTVADNLTNIDTVAGIAGDISTVAGVSAGVTAVAGNATNINAVASDIASINAVAADLTNIDNASTYAAEAKQWAIGDPTEPSDGSAKYWAEQASHSVPNDGQLDIQVNGTSVATFTANQSGNTTANIVVGSGLPSQTGNAGKFLNTDGTDASWEYSIKNKGSYSSSTQYYPGDVVQYYYDNANRKYLCIAPVKNSAPFNEASSYWMPFDSPSQIRVQNDWGDKPILPFMMNGSSGSKITGVMLTPGTTSTIANFPTINTSTGLLKAPSGIDGYYTSAQVDALIPTVNNSTITFTQGGVNKGSFTLNQSTGATIALDAGGGGGIQNTATGTDSLTILGNATSYGDSINIGDYSSANGVYAVAIGGQSGDAYYAEASANGTSVGAGAGASSGSVAVGYQAQTEGSDNIAVGRDTYIDSDASSSVAIGNGASVTGEGNTVTNAIQLGSGTNSTANSLQVGSYELLDTSTGLIPDARISTNIARTADVVSTSDLATCHVVVETGTSGNNWYRKWSDGWLEQGGIADYGSDARSTNATITFPKAFSNTNYTIQYLAQRSGTSGNCNGASGCRNKSKTGIYLTWYGNGSNDYMRYFNWSAAGF